MSLHLGLALQGNLAKHIEAELRAAEQGVTEGVRRTARDLQAAFRARTRAANLGPKLERAWGRADYPKGGASLGAASDVYSKARRIHEAFAEGVTIGPKHKRFLVVPLEGARRLKLDRGLQQSKGNRERKWAQIQAAVAKFGALRWIKISGGRFLLVADNLTAGGARSKTRHRDGEFSPIAGRRQSVPLFLLVRQVRLGKRLDLKPDIDRAHSALPGNILAAWPKVI